MTVNSCFHKYALNTHFGFSLTSVVAPIPFPHRRQSSNGYRHEAGDWIGGKKNYIAIAIEHQNRYNMCNEHSTKNRPSHSLANVANALV